MSEHISSPQISPRSLIRGGAAAAALAAGLPLPSRAAGRPRPTAIASMVIANVRVSHDHYGVHLGPSLAANPRHPRQLLVACQAAPTGNPKGLVCVVADELSHWDSSGDLVGHAVAVSSTDAGNTLGAPVQLGRGH